MSSDAWVIMKPAIYFSHGYYLCFFSFLLIYGGLGVGDLGLGP